MIARGNVQQRPGPGRRPRSFRGGDRTPTGPHLLRRRSDIVQPVRVGPAGIAVATGGCLRIYSLLRVQAVDADLRDCGRCGDAEQSRPGPGDSPVTYVVFVLNRQVLINRPGGVAYRAVVSARGVGGRSGVGVGPALGRSRPGPGFGGCGHRGNPLGDGYVIDVNLARRTAILHGQPNAAEAHDPRFAAGAGRRRRNRRRARTR